MELERRASTDLKATGGRKLAGYAAVFDQEARIDGFTEVIRPGAFASDLKSGKDILALMDHNPSKLLARTKSGSLRLWEDNRGLAFELDLPDTQAGRDALVLAERGDLGGMSFGFTVPSGGDVWNKNRRELRSVNLHEITVISSWPAYKGTTVAVRAKTPALLRAKRWMETI